MSRPIVHHDAGRRAADAIHDGGDDRGERRRLEIAFAHLNEIDAGVGCPLRLQGQDPRAAGR